MFKIKNTLIKKLLLIRLKLLDIATQVPNGRTVKNGWQTGIISIYFSSGIVNFVIIRSFRMRFLSLNVIENHVGHSNTSCVIIGIVRVVENIYFMLA